MQPAVMKRTYLDPVHKDIVLDRKRPWEGLIMDLIDTEEFQRLRRIQQLGVTYFTFQGAEGSRFTHSVGVMHIASQLIDMIAEKSPSIRERSAIILASALLHDLGHGPFSHVTEKIVGYHHEDWSCKIISGDTHVREILDSFKEERGLPEKIVQVLKKQYKPQYVSHIVSSQLDCDRFDYLLRDSYMTGTEYGVFALQRILSSMEIDERHDRIIVAGEKGQIAVEDYLFARFSMYAQVYYHKKNLASRALLSKLIKRARHVMNNGSISFIDESTRKWLSGDELFVKDYLNLDDTQLTYHIKRWLTDQDSILADLSARFLHRKLFKATRIPDLQNATPGQSAEQIDKIERQAKEVAAHCGLDPEYYIAIESSGIRPYDYYRPEADVPQTNILVRTENGDVRELSEVSPTVNALVRGNYESNWLVHPVELAEKLTNIKDLMPVR
jgi:HD superfamily phosphohydrolase